ncbi:hypothetical protein EYF80_006705 [Liparis tanakae]|uniref:Uncharacterized protein n=1 Tax=Liparis tanakae TaxID=230148 RepID=A0A4Z2J094_9TELE|nr:hypothetical protein EYF80_006705 [Liparis tanakae]
MASSDLTRMPETCAGSVNNTRAREGTQVTERADTPNRPLRRDGWIFQKDDEPNNSKNGRWTLTLLEKADKMLMSLPEQLNEASYIPSCPDAVLHSPPSLITASCPHRKKQQSEEEVLTRLKAR